MSKIIVDAIQKTSGTALTWPSADGTTGQFIKTDGSATLSFATAGGGGKIGQVLQTLKTDTYSTTTTSTWADVTGLTVAITPAAATSKVLVMVHVYESGSGTAASAYHYFRVTRGGTAIGVGATAGNRSRIGWQSQHGSSTALGTTTPYFFLDSPSSTSALTYAVQNYLQTAGTLYINRSGNDTDSADYGRGTSSITVMEVLA